MIEVPGFGRISLAKLTVDRAFHLKMAHVEADQSTGGIKELGRPKRNGIRNNSPVAFASPSKTLQPGIEQKIGGAGELSLTCAAFSLLNS
jgi:hypothetical protein